MVNVISPDTLVIAENSRNGREVVRTYQTLDTSASAADLDVVIRAPGLQRFFRGFLLEVVPSINGAPVLQKILEAGIGTRPAEDLSNLIEIVGQVVARECQHQRFAEIEFALVRDGDVSFVVLDVVRQFFNIVRPFGMPVDLACLLAQMASFSPAPPEFTNSSASRSSLKLTAIGISLRTSGDRWVESIDDHTRVMA